jgi:amidohydrolase
MPTISPEVERLIPEMRRVRRDLHANPELGFQERRTADIVARRLTELGYQMRTGLGRTGVAASLRGTGAGKTVMVRADMDALPIEEQTDVPWRSRWPGAMHACGHDAHTSIVLALADVLAAEMRRHSGSLLLLFQPAEELLQGAPAMLADGALGDRVPDAAFSVHMHNEQSAGKVAIRSGPVLASADRIRITVRGRGGHGAFPHLAADPVVAAAHLVTAVQTLVSRETPPLESAVLSITMLKAGTAFNVIPDTVEMEGTLRCFEAALRENLLESLDRTVSAVASALRCTGEVRTEWLTPAVVNDPETTRTARAAAAAVVGEDNVVEMPRIMGSDDLAYFWQRVPGCYVFIGSAKTDGSEMAPHHNARFDIDERAMEIGAEVLLGAVRRALDGTS